MVFLYFIKDLPRPESFTEGIIAQSTKIYDRTGEIMLYEISGEEKRTLVPLGQIPLPLQQALIATEDKHFYEHVGFNFRSVVRALLVDLKLQKSAQGASTISQQLIRTYFLTRHKTLKRKTRELLLTLELERRYPKEKILEWYLNIIPFGSNLYGVEAASNAFFGKPVNEISTPEAAILVALVKAPSFYSPYGDNLTALLERKTFVLQNMVEDGFITEKEKQKFAVEEITLHRADTNFKAPHFVMFVKDYLETKYTLQYLQRAGLKVITTLDYALQEKAEKAVKEGVVNAAYAKTNNGALVALSPKTGELLAMVGSKDYFGTSTPKGCLPGKNCLFDPQVNVAISKRQPGSSFKPFVYALAFYNGFTPQTHVWDVNTEFNYNCPATGLAEKDRHGTPCYHPQNYDGLFKGQIDLKSALAQSRNLPAVKVLYLVGLKNALDFVKKFGITTLGEEKNYGLSLVLGGGEVKLLEMVLGYSVFANEGIKPQLNFIKEIKDQNGKIIEKMQLGGVKIIPQKIAREINDILADNSARAPMFGWNSSLFVGEEYAVAVKTGTTQEYRDAWTIGYTPNLVVGTWAGNNDNTSMTKASSSIAAPMWKNFMLAVLPMMERKKFTAPQQRKTGVAVLDGQFLGNHSILYYLNKNNPLDPGNSRNDSQFSNWEGAIQNWLNWH